MVKIEPSMNILKSMEFFASTLALHQTLLFPPAVSINKLLSVAGVMLLSGLTDSSPNKETMSQSVANGL